MTSNDCRSETKRKMKWSVLAFVFYGLQLINGKELRDANEVLTSASHSSDKAKAPNEIQESIPDANEFPTCKSMKLADFYAPSGMYIIRINHNKTIEVYCEMGLNGGGYTFITPKSLAQLNNSELMPLFTDKSNFLLRVRKKDGSQPYAVLKQLTQYALIPLKLGLNDYTGYSPPMNIVLLGTPFLYFGFLSIQEASNFTIQGLQVNGFENTFVNCDKNPNSYFTLYPDFLEFYPTSYDVPGPFCDRIFSHLIKNPSGRVMPPEMFIFGEIHWGGCGCFKQTLNIPDVFSLAIGFR